jgi:hypothetical protein
MSLICVGTGSDVMPTANSCTARNDYVVVLNYARERAPVCFGNVFVRELVVDTLAVDSNEVCTWAMTSTRYLDAIGPEAEMALRRAVGTPGVNRSMVVFVGSYKSISVCLSRSGSSIDYPSRIYLRSRQALRYPSDSRCELMWCPRAARSWIISTPSSRSRSQIWTNLLRNSTMRHCLRNSGM